MPLTTVAQPKEERGEALAELAHALLEGRSDIPARQVMPTSRVVRRSCGALLRTNCVRMMS